jgi:hypothetical protein
VFLTAQIDAGLSYVLSIYHHCRNQALSKSTFQLLTHVAAVIVGFVPAFAVLFRLAREKKPSYNPHGYQKQHEGGSGARGQPGFVMSTVSGKTRRDRKNVGLDTTDSIWANDTGSQDGLTSGTKQNEIMVTTTLQQDHGPARG